MTKSAKVAISLPNYHIAGRHEAGCDEAGRGCLAGPVYAAAVILPDDFHHPWLNDSKQVSERRREQLRPIIEAEALAWGIGIVDNEEIDHINILRASILAMHRALDALSLTPGGIIVDGNKFSDWRQGIEWTTFVKGDSRFGNIAAASILAKTHRDEFMRRAAEQYPQYHWDVNKGYPTADHRAAIAEYGATPLHRHSFRLLPYPSIFD